MRAAPTLRLVGSLLILASVAWLASCASRDPGPVSMYFAGPGESSRTVLALLPDGTFTDFNRWGAGSGTWRRDREQVLLSYDADADDPAHTEVWLQEQGRLRLAFVERPVFLYGMPMPMP